MSIKNVFLIIFTNFFLLGPLFSSETNPNFNGEILIIPAVDSQKIGSKYQDVILKLNEQGEWLLLDYKLGREIQKIEKVEIIQTKIVPIQVFLKVSGSFSDGCQNIGQIRHKLVENNFEVFIYHENNNNFSPEEFTCTAAIKPFNIIIPLPVYSLKKGEYQYIVNRNFTGTFNLISDNVLKTND